MDYRNKCVLFVTGSLSGGGAERVLSILAAGCAELGADVTVVLLRDRKVTYTVSPKVKYIQLHEEGKLKSIKRIIALHRILKKSDATAVIPFLFPVTLYSMIANIGVGKRLIVSERADPTASIKELSVDKQNAVAIFLMRKMRLIKISDWMVFQTPDAQDYYGKSIRKRSSVIPNPLDLDHLPRPSRIQREKIIVAAGRLSNEKNFEMLIEGFGEFHAKHPDYKLIIFGEGEERKNLESILKKLHLEDSVEMPGFINNLAEKMVAASVYVSTSNHEGISNSMLEALGMGVPTIVTDCPIGGARMFVHTDENGILIPMNDKVALVEAMCRIVENEEYARRISHNALKIRQELNAEVICRKWLELV